MFVQMCWKKLNQASQKLLKAQVTKIWHCFYKTFSSLCNINFFEDVLKLFCFLEKQVFLWKVQSDELYSACQ